MNPREIDHLRGPILRSVSRSFYLSLRLLPSPLRDPLSLAYLLARATDTIADTPEPPVELRREALRNLAGAIQGETPSASTSEIRDSFAPLQSNEEEQALIDSLPSILEWLTLLGKSDRDEVRSVLQKINRGQMLDLERFGIGDGIRALSTAADLDEYTYLVAGSVGEFWTKLCFAHLEKFTDLTEQQMLSSAVQYGKGLQLINILRDIGSDLRAGRCYLPTEELGTLGVAPSEILANPARVESIMQHWRGKAETDLQAGIEYACAINQRSVRFATALPALLGARTLALMRAAGPDVFERTVKVPRTEVTKIMSSAALTFPSASSLRRRFDQLSA